MLKNICTKVVSAVAARTFNAIGNKNPMEADAVAVEAARTYLNSLNIDGRICIGEGERDEAPMLFKGEKVGLGGKIISIAIDPLEGTNMCANNLPGALSVIAMMNGSNMPQLPDIYMKKLVTCIPIPKGTFNLSDSISNNILAFCKVTNMQPKEVNVCMLNRPRHNKDMEEIIKIGANLVLIEDGDIMAIMKTYQVNSQFTTMLNEVGAITEPIHIYCGIGGAPEGIISYAFVNCVSGTFLGQLYAQTEGQQQKLNAVPSKYRDVLTSEQFMRLNIDATISNRIQEGKDTETMQQEFAFAISIITGKKHGYNGNICTTICGDNITNQLEIKTVKL